MDTYQALKQNSLAFKLKKISFKALFFMDMVPCDIYAVIDGLFRIVVHSHSLVNRELLKELLGKGAHELYVLSEDQHKVINTFQESLRNVTRSLSIGDPIQKGRKQINLLALNLNNLYDNPHSDENLNLQFQSAQNLAKFLVANQELIPTLYLEFLKSKHHYILAQPIISSLFLIALLRQSHLYSEKEVESLFLTSFFKDIGMSIIPSDKYDKKDLSLSDKHLINQHTEFSQDILRGRIPLSANYLDIIRNHHSISNVKDSENELYLAGFETMIITVMDIIAAVISERPYRKPGKLYEALEIIKSMIGNKYPQEFKLIVFFFKSFFSKLKK